jgi:hypothetical protein
LTQRAQRSEHRGNGEIQRGAKNWRPFFVARGKSEAEEFFGAYYQA